MAPPYTRDLIGYGATPPHAQRPGDARIAPQFVIDYEEGSENSIVHGDPASEGRIDIARHWIANHPFAP
jgi:hypothetical protein